MKKTITIGLLVLFTGSVYTQDNLELAEKAFSSGDIETANQKILEFHKSAPKSYASCLLTAHILIAKKNYEEARDFLDCALQKRKEGDLSPIYDYIKLYVAEGNLRQAFKLTLSSMKKSPEDKELKQLLVSLYIRVKRYDKALSLIENYKAEDSNDYRLIVKEAMIYYQKGDLEKADTSIKWAIAIKPDNAELYFNQYLIQKRVALNLFASGKKEESKKILEEAKKNLNKSTSGKENPQINEEKKILDELLNAV